MFILTVNSVKNLFEKIKEVELESKNNNLSIEDMSKIHKIVHYEIDELMEKYLLIPRANRISLIIKDNKTAQNILQEQLKKIISDIQAINEEHIKKLSNNFINTKMNMNNNINQNKIAILYRDNTYENYLEIIKGAI